MITSSGLHDLNSIVIPRLGFPFLKFSFQISKIRGRNELSDLQGNFGQILKLLRAKCGRPTTLLGRPACPWALFNSVFSHCIVLVERSTFILWNGKILRRKRGSLPLNPSTHPLLSHFSSKALVHPLPCHGSLQCSIYRCCRKEDPTIERGITRQGHVVCFGRIDKPHLKSSMSQKEKRKRG
jgi:hypothetical protein